MNSSLIKRIGWYLIGFSLGLLALAFILKKKSGGKGVDFCYLPNCRVLKDFRNKPLLNAQGDSILFENLTIDLKMALEEGSVDFSASETETKPCKIYKVDFEGKEYNLKNCPKFWTILQE